MLWSSHTDPVVHLLLCGCCQSDRPPLFGPLRSVDGKSVFGVVQHRNQDGDFVDEGMKVLEKTATGIHRDRVIKQTLNIEYRTVNMYGQKQTLTSSLPFSPRKNCNRWTGCHPCCPLVLRTAPGRNERPSTCVASSLSTIAWFPSSPTRTVTGLCVRVREWMNNLTNKMKERKKTTTYRKEKERTFPITRSIHLFYGLFIMSEIIHFSLRPFTELLEDLSPPRCCLGWSDGQTHGLDRLDQSWRKTRRKNRWITDWSCKGNKLDLWTGSELVLFKILIYLQINKLFRHWSNKCGSWIHQRKAMSYNSQVFTEQLNQLSWEWLSTEQPPPLTHAHTGCSSVPYVSSMARV